MLTNYRITPMEETLRDVMPSSFILHLPKEYLSGDFYCLLPSVNRKGFLFALADCGDTGEAGNYMSTMGPSLFYKALKTLDQRTPKKVIRQIRKLILKTLYKKDSLSASLVDTSLVHYDGEAHILHFSGAHNPVYILRNGKTPLTTTKGLSIGHELEKDELRLYKINGDESQLTRDDDTIKVRKLQLLKGDELFMASDGYSDQFGGKNNSQFNENSFQELIMRIYGKNCEDQKGVLKDVIDNWRGENEQTDDICVAGMKV